MIQKNFKFIAVFGQIIYTFVIGELNAADIRKRKFCIKIGNVADKFVLRFYCTELSGVITYRIRELPSKLLAMVAFERFTENSGMKS